MDGGVREPLSDAQAKAWLWLSKCYRKLGADGSALVDDVLLPGMSAKQIAEAQGLKGGDGAR